MVVLRSSLAALCLLLSGLSSVATAADFEISVSPAATAEDIQDALQAARQHRSAAPTDTIIIKLPRQLVLDRPITLTAADSGRADAPLVIQGAPEGGSVISGGLELATAPVQQDGSQIVGRLPARFLPEIRQASLAGEWDRISPALQPKDSLKEIPRGRLFLFEGSRRLQPSRWPASGYATKPAISDRGDGQAELRLPDSATDIGGEANLWIAGYWTWNWWFEAASATVVDGRNLRFAAPVNAPRDSARYYLFNVADALSSPGSYYLDSEGKRVFYIPGAGEAEQSLQVAFAESLLHVTNATNLRVEGVAFEKSIGPAVLIENARDVTLANCFVGKTGGDGILVEGGLRVTIDRCVVDDTGYSGIQLSGGNRNTLAPAGHSVSHSKVSRFGQEMPTYRPGIRLFGVGQTIEACEISDGPHAGIIFSGNNHSISGNVLHDLVTNSEDAGAIYAGRNWTSRGTVIAGNYLYDIRNRIGPGQVMGVYLDDQLSGTTVSRNVFQNVDDPVLLGGGRDNVIEDNLFLSRKSPVWMDSRGTTWQADMVKPGGAYWNGLEEVPYESPIYASRYPGLASLLTDRPGSPINNTISHNLSLTVPFVYYEPPANAGLGTEADNLKIDGADTFPAILQSIPAKAQALQKLKELPARIEETRQTISTLPFAGRAQ
ncbi:right-handed parallel beta-helix repeat-containing protein [Rhizobium sp. BK251]|uniref:right-handed parallel beta-helix repeat-containing protein n=1 Tax=Rhizobium sp. BK251 TaxID=2512125 RepID=UPI00104592F2|nr:right-handed parallel beta-helix repeat-containing protein [Rhizobium sp. BK251]TCL72979.1 parallel beta helix pectate lyase-like protein [Rhizobium sp. BK251]